MSWSLVCFTEASVENVIVLPITLKSALGPDAFKQALARGKMLDVHNMARMLLENQAGLG